MTVNYLNKLYPTLNHRLDKHKANSSRNENNPRSVIFVLFLRPLSNRIISNDKIENNREMLD